MRTCGKNNLQLKHHAFFMKKRRKTSKFCTSNKAVLYIFLFISQQTLPRGDILIEKTTEKDLADPITACGFLHILMVLSINIFSFQFKSEIAVKKLL